MSKKNRGPFFNLGGVCKTGTPITETPYNLLFDVLKGSIRSPRFSNLGIPVLQTLVVGVCKTGTPKTRTPLNQLFDVLKASIYNETVL